MYILEPFPFYRPRFVEPDFVPPGYCSLRKAVDQVGRHFYGAQWIGKERLARTRQEAEADQKLSLNSERFIREEAARTKAKLEGVSPRLAVKELRRTVPAAVLQALANIEKHHQAEDEALGRWHQAFQWLRRKLYEQAIAAEILEARNGRLYAVPFGSWGTDQAWQHLKAGQGQFSASVDGQSYGWMGWIFISKRQLADLLVAQTPTKDAAVSESMNVKSNVLALEQSKSPATNRRRGRRPGEGSLAVPDAPLVGEMRRLIEEGDCGTPTEAARKVVERADGGGTEDSKIRRLERRYGKKFPDGAKIQT